MRILLIAALAALPLTAADDANIWSNADLNAIKSKLTQNVNADNYALETFGQFGNHNVLMVYREASGPSETHAEWTDFYVVQSGTATLLVGGTVTNPRVAPLRRTVVVRKMNDVHGYGNRARKTGGAGLATGRVSLRQVQPQAIICQLHVRRQALTGGRMRQVVAHVGEVGSGRPDP